MNRSRIHANIRAGVWSSVFCAAGALHFMKPALFDALVPAQLPGTQRAWTVGSGAVEIALGSSIAAAAVVPGWRPYLHSVVGPAAAIFLAGVWPGNIKMALDWVGSPRVGDVQKAIAVARVPLQIPMIMSTLKL